MMVRVAIVCQFLAQAELQVVVGHRDRSLCQWASREAQVENTEMLRGRHQEVVERCFILQQASHRLREGKQRLCMSALPAIDRKDCCGKREVVHHRMSRLLQARDDRKTTQRPGVTISG